MVNSPHMSGTCKGDKAVSYSDNRLEPTPRRPGPVKTGVTTALTNVCSPCEESMRTS